MHTRFWLIKLKRRDQSEDLGVDGKTILGWILKKQVRKEWIRYMWCRIGTSCGLL